MAVAWKKEPVEELVDLKEWLIDQAQDKKLSYLLAHADDGIIWGVVKGNELILSGNAFGGVFVALRRETLQQARLFGSAGELLLWRVEGGFEARSIIDGETPGPDAFEETHHLWGSATGRANKNFTLMEEGQQGFYHALPLALNKDERTALQVRHYIEYDDQDQAYIALSRLVKLVPIGGKNGAEA